MTRQSSARRMTTRHRHRHLRLHWSHNLHRSACFSEQKRRAKAAKKAALKAEKERKALESGKIPPKKKEEDPVDPRVLDVTTTSTLPSPSPSPSQSQCRHLQLYFENRSKMMVELEKDGVNPYPHKFHADTSIPHLVATYNYLATGVSDFCNTFVCDSFRNISFLRLGNPWRKSFRCRWKNSR